MSTLIDIAEAVVAELNAEAAKPEGGALGQGLVAKRHYRPLFELSQLGTLRVSVVPRGISISNLGRNSNQHDAAVDVAVQKKVGPADGTQASTTELDGLMQLTESIADFFRLRRLVSAPSAIWVKTENNPVYSVEHLEQHRVFTSVLTLTFRICR